MACGGCDHDWEDDHCSDSHCRGHESVDGLPIAVSSVFNFEHRGKPITPLFPSGVDSKMRCCQQELIGSDVGDSFSTFQKTFGVVFLNSQKQKKKHSQSYPKVTPDVYASMVIVVSA